MVLKLNSYTLAPKLSLFGVVSVLIMEEEVLVSTMFWLEIICCIKFLELAIILLRVIDTL